MTRQNCKQLRVLIGSSRMPKIRIQRVKEFLNEDIILVMQEIDGMKVTYK